MLKFIIYIIDANEIILFLILSQKIILLIIIIILYELSSIGSLICKRAHEHNPTISNPWQVTKLELQRATSCIKTVLGGGDRGRCFPMLGQQLPCLASCRSQTGWVGSKARIRQTDQKPGHSTTPIGNKSSWTIKSFMYKGVYNESI